MFLTKRQEEGLLMLREVERRRKGAEPDSPSGCNGAWTERSWIESIRGQLCLAHLNPQIIGPLRTAGLVTTQEFIDDYVYVDMWLTDEGRAVADARQEQEPRR